MVAKIISRDRLGIPNGDDMEMQDAHSHHSVTYETTRSINGDGGRAKEVKP